MVRIEKKRVNDIHLLRLHLMQFAESHSLEELLVETLDRVESLSKSSIGFYHFYDADKQIVHRQAWSTGTMTKYCRTSGKGHHSKVGEKGVLADCIRQGKPVIQNDYAALCHRRVLPEGHATITRILVVPLKRGGKIVAVLGVGNKAHAYNETDAETIALIADLSWDIAERKKAAQTITQNEELYRAIVNSQTEFVDRFLPGGILTFVNDPLCKYVGMSREELLGKSFYPFIHEDDRDRLIHDIESLTAENPVSHYENRAILRDGSIRWHHWTNHAILDNYGNIVEYQAVGRNITEQKLAELALLESEEKYRRLYETMIDGFVLVDFDGMIREWNESYRAMLGYTTEELSHKNYKDITPEKWHDFENRIILEEVIPLGYSRVFEKEYIRKDGTIFPVELRANLLRDHLGKATGMWAIIRDISERKQSLIKLKQSEQRFRTLASATFEGITISEKGRFVDVNDQLAKMLGFEKSEMVGMAVGDLIPPESRELVLANILSGKDIQVEHKMLCKDGTFRIVEAHGQTMEEQGRAFRLTALRDITDRKETEIALQQANDALEMRVAERTASLAKANEQNKMISFQLVRAQEQERTRIAGELHDQVGQSLLLAKMKADMLASEIPHNSKRKCVVDISSLLETSIHDIRTLTFGMRPPLLDTAGIEAALECLCTSMQRDYNLMVDFSCSCQPHPPAGEMRYSLYQAVRELLLNVAKHAEVNRAELSLHTAGGILVVHVIDAGVGFNQPAAHLEIVTSGGFGLFNVQHRIEQMGGEFVIATASGHGTTVTLNIPMEE